MAIEPTWEAVEFLNFQGEDAPRPPYKLCPSNGDVLATPVELCTRAYIIIWIVSFPGTQTAWEWDYILADYYPNPI